MAEPQQNLVRVAVVGARIVLDRQRRLPGRGAYVHLRPDCFPIQGVSIPGLARGLRRAVTAIDAQRLVLELNQMLRDGDNSIQRGAGRPGWGDLREKNPSGLAGTEAVETPSLAGHHGRG